MAAEAGPTSTDTFTGNWAWLFPLSYLVHIAEEYWGGFPAWIARFWDVESSSSNFLSWNGGALIMMALGVALSLRTKSYRWLLVSFGTVILVNGLAHALASVATWSYSPGVISGLLLFIPLGTITLLRARGSVNRRTFRAGVIVGVLMHVVVVLLAFGFARLSA
ncbi:MAG TPA: HXXEE domain-containing protein [Pyrinomonadaceae bacterium]|nr:HXXEE domain-containing protein [Pyrinomonadaceae bacterium]